jgi:hypothetical protein
LLLRPRASRCRSRIIRPELAGALLVFTIAASGAQPEYQRRIDAVRRTPGFVALWDFVKREGGRFAAHGEQSFPLDAVNYVREYWNEGSAATYDDFPLLGSGPFGEAVQIRSESDKTFRPLLMVPRDRMHDTRLDVKGPGKSVSMIAWIARESGNHAIAGIWHEGTDLKDGAAAKVERGRRQYALFAGLAANNGASAVHVSENGASSFGDRYARNLAVTPQVIPDDKSWTTVGFTFDNERNVVTAWINGEANDYWIDNPQQHPFFKWPAQGWRQGLYMPPENRPLSREVVDRKGGVRTELHRYAFTKVRVTLRENGEVISRELVSLRANPFWFAHDLYTPPSAADGGPFTIGRVIHSSRSVGFTGYIGGVAVFDRALPARHMKRLMQIGRDPILVH